MKHKYLFLLAIGWVTLSCNFNKTQVNEKTIDSLTINSKRITNSISVTLIPNAKKAMADWKEFNTLDDFILTYYNIPISEALNNAEELASLVKVMKDTIRVGKIDIPSVIARFNVLHNETLRLADMATISSITDEEVESEVTQILDVYAAVNAKINTIYKAQDIQNSLEVDTETPIDLDNDEDRTVSPTGVGIGKKMKPLKQNKKQ